MPGLHALLAEKTRTRHDQLDALPFFQALQDGTLPPLPVVNFLRGLLILHAVFERELGHTSLPGLSTLAEGVAPKVPLLVADLAMLESELLPSIEPAMQRALDAGAEILRHRANVPFLAGVLYVLEGSQGGGLQLRRAYADRLGVSPAQLAYWGCYGEQTPIRWSAFVERLNALSLPDSDRDRVVEGAERCYAWIEGICAALHPHAAQDVKYHVAAVNFEAGDHAMPQDPREIALALRAGRLAWDDFPYLDQRYGNRGQRFTSSDSCWLVSLVHMPEATVTRSLQWLRGVLASRGIPSTILEGHLRHITAALADELPDQRELTGRYEPFLAACETERRAAGIDDVVAARIQTFNQRLSACPGTTVPSAASLMASAWLDDRAGISGARDAVQSWFVDPTRFHDDWIALVQALVASLDAIRRDPC